MSAIIQHVCNRLFRSVESSSKRLTIHCNQVIRTNSAVASDSPSNPRPINQSTTNRPDEIPNDGQPTDNNNRYVNRKDPRLQSFRPPSASPSETSVLLFPGQGSQFVGMCRQLQHNSVVQNLFRKANQILGYDLLELCLKGPANDLEQTVHCQPAIFVASLAGVNWLNRSFLKLHFNRFSSPLSPLSPLSLQPLKNCAKTCPV